MGAFQWLGGDSGMKATLMFVAILLSGCGMSNWPQQNFHESFASEVGKTIEDPTSRVGRYPESVVARRQLPNGMEEIEYMYSHVCMVFFEVDPKTKMIVSWRYEKKEARACQMPP